MDESKLDPSSGRYLSLYFDLDCSWHESKFYLAVFNNSCPGANEPNRARARYI
ncbi:hypothetical protein Hanom_Chr04g00384511 [Helianthus anomalus]